MSDPILERWNQFLLAEGVDEACNRYFDPDTGHFTSKEDAARKGGTYSISKAASDRCGDVEAKPGKMKVTSTGKLKPKFTLAQCGRTDAQSGAKKSKRKRCRDYPRGRYGDENTKTQREGRENQPEERRERYFPGNRELTRLARGIYEVEDEPGLIVRPDEVDPEELTELVSVLLGEQQKPCPQHCIGQVLNLFARIKQAEKGEAQ